MKTLLLAGPTVAVLAAANLVPAMAQATKPVSQVVQWNRTLLVIVRTPGAQPATIHPTRSFAIMHGAIYDAVNAIDGTHKPYLVRLSASHPHSSCASLRLVHRRLRHARSQRSQSAARRTDVSRSASTTKSSDANDRFLGDTTSRWRGH